MAPEVVTYTPEPAEFAWTFGGVPPVFDVTPGTVMELWTEDCFAGRVRGPEDFVSKVIEFPFVNPQTGPFLLRDAKPGDTLVLHFLSIEPSRDWAASTTVPLFGALSGTHANVSLQDPLPERVWIYEIDKVTRTVSYEAVDSDHVVTLPLDPMHGTVGVAPASFEARSSLVPAEHGGNMDTPEIRAGSTVYIGINVEGALFSIGDGHCRQGEGEACGVAVEGAMDTVVIVDLIKGRSCAWPRIETDNYIMTTGSARPLEDAFRIAQSEMVYWLAGEFGFSHLDAYQFVTQAVESPVGNVCDPNYTFVAKMQKRWLPGGVVMDGTHDRMKALADAYRQT